jgi:hypothetical protein
MLIFKNRRKLAVQLGLAKHEIPERFAAAAEHFRNPHRPGSWRPRTYSAPNPCTLPLLANAPTWSEKWQAAKWPRPVLSSSGGSTS